MKLHLLTRKEDLHPHRLAGKVVVVFDVLFATTSLVTALANGAKEAWPVPDAAAARERARHLDQPIVSGELNADTLPGFVDPTPQALLAAGVANHSLVYATTNGTVALSASQGATTVYAAALVNAAAMARYLVAHHADQTVLLVCAGSSGAMNLEDMIGAGACIARLRDLAGGETRRVSDAAQTAYYTYAGARASGPDGLIAALRRSHIGRIIRSRGGESEVDYAAMEDRFNGVCVMHGARMVWQAE